MVYYVSNIGHFLLLPINLSIFQLCDSNSCRSLPLNFCKVGLVLLFAFYRSKCKGKLFAIVLTMSANYRFRDSWKIDNNRKSKEPKTKSIKIKSDSCTGSNIQSLKVLLQYWKNYKLHYNYCAF